MSRGSWAGVDAAERAAFLERLRATIAAYGSVNALAKAAGVSEGALRKWSQGMSEPQRDRLVAVARVAGVRVEWLATGLGPRESEGRSDLPVLEGYRALPWLEGEQTAGRVPIAFEADWLESGTLTDADQLRVLRVPDASMEPQMPVGCLVIVDVRASDVRRDGIYALRVEGQSVVRRVQRLPGDTWEISPDNPAFRAFQITRDDPSVAVLGSVVWVARHV